MFELPWIALFVTWSSIWWIAFIVVNILLLCAIANTHTGRADDDHIPCGRWALSIFICWFIAMEFFGTLGFFSWFAENPLWHTLCLAGAYFVGGSVWAIVWWSLRCSSRRHDYNDELMEFLKKNDYHTQSIPDKLPGKLQDLWTEYLLRSDKWSYYCDKIYAPKRNKKIRLELSAWDHRYQIITHMAWWPWSIIWSIFADVFRGIWRCLHSLYSTALEKISKWSFRGTEGHFNQDDPKDGD